MTWIRNHGIFPHLRAAALIAQAVMAGSALAACATHPTEPAVKTVPVNMAVATSCVPDNMPPAPTYTDTGDIIRDAVDFSIRYQLFAANWAVKNSRLALDEKVIDDCRKAAKP